MRTYYEDIQAIENEIHLIDADCEYQIVKAMAEFLSISIEECYDFIKDMQVETDTVTPDEIEQMYVDYCMEYDIPCLQISDYACYDRMGW